ncbi:aminotransferase class V-fold PLP-dependent enzyme [Cytophagaceae bacterium DM2B3-1]|uniref:Aminotransferase class V-fold PLP-dependent enzyme n=2 Tax=Xanthocytophaga flava TaxID=3048013 RepID=A0ABT7CVB8_9BACT|nr:aminotransferase class V-fold PLP-dependent enzyme [Xanthocytophaga flavus]
MNSSCDYFYRTTVQKPSGCGIFTLYYQRAMQTPLSLLQEIIESYQSQIFPHTIAPHITTKQLEKRLHSYDFQEPIELATLTTQVSNLLKEGNLHVPHPGYFGLYNPATTQASIIADALVALYNPQLAVHSHSPAANAIEKHVLDFMAQHIGYSGDYYSCFTSGGSEANHMGLLAALAHQYPAYVEEGVWALEKQPVVYISEAGHNSFDKVVKNIGLGSKTLRKIPLDKSLKISLFHLEEQIQKDILAGYDPAVLIGTAGTTGSGTIDPLPQLAKLAEKYDLWFHVDAAWAGAAVLSEKLKSYLNGIEQADSITIDAHKWLSTSMGAGMFFTKHSTAVQTAFNIPAAYMPSHLQTEPYATSLQWSRRFIGLKLFMVLAEKGQNAIATQMEYQCQLAEYMKEKLMASGWLIINDSPVAVLNFTHPSILSGSISTDKMQKQVEQEGNFWLSTIPIAEYGKVLRAGVTSLHTREEHIDQLMDRLNQFVNS